MSDQQPDGQGQFQPPPVPPAPTPEGQYSVPAPPAPPSYGTAPAYGAPPVAIPPRPKAMDNAVRLMQVGGVIGIINALSVLFMRGQIKDAVRDANTGASQSTVDAAVSFAVVFGLIFGLLGAGLWFWMASANGKGKSWARIVATVFFGIAVLSFLSSFARAGGTAVSIIIALLIVLVGGAAMFFMYKKESTEWYKANSAPRV